MRAYVAGAMSMCPAVFKWEENRIVRRVADMRRGLREDVRAQKDKQAKKYLGLEEVGHVLKSFWSNPDLRWVGVVCCHIECLN